MKKKRKKRINWRSFRKRFD